MGDNKLEGETRNLESDNVRALQEAFPEVVADGKVDFEKLKLILGEDVDDSDERYSFTWPGKRDAIKMAISRTTGTLRPDKKNSKDWDTTSNLFIEGDNLEVLRVLQNSYRGKVKMIYIDPPYNTGRDFIYKDDFKDNLRNYKENASLEGQSNPETAGRYHTNWLNMLYPRLRLAKNLLREDGVIFISIDDNEVHNLRKVCDEIFGEFNFIDQIIWKKTENIKMDSRFISQNKDYILCYRKSSLLTEFQKQQSDINRFNLEDEKGKYYLRKLDSKSSAYRKTLDYVIEHEGVKYYAGSSYEDWLMRQKGEVGGFAPRWLWSEEKFKRGLSEGEIIFKNGQVYNKVRYDEVAKKPHVDIQTLVSGQTAQKQLDELFGKRLFDHPKPPQLVEWMIGLSSDDKDAIILDFFAGSATTAHAVMKINACDGGARRYIVVQVPEMIAEGHDAIRAGMSNIAQLSRKRIELAGEKIKTDQKDKLAERTSPLDVGFKAFTLDTTNFREWDSNTDNIQDELLAALETFKEGRTSEDALYEVLLKYGVDITEPVEVLNLGGKQVYSLAGNYLLVCLEKDIPLSTIEAMTALKPGRVVCYDDGFADEDVKQNALETLKRAGVADVRVV